MTAAENHVAAIQRVGLVGAGAAAAAHLHALRRLRNVQVVGILDHDHSRAVAVAARFGLPREIADPGRFYTAAGPQLVHVATPPHTHETVAMEALEHRTHVLTEKPPALTVAACERLQSRADARKLTIGVNENTAWDPLIGNAARMIAAGQLGGLLHIDGVYCFGIGPDELPPGWACRLPGGMLEDLLPHLIVTARALSGRHLTLEHWHLGSAARVEGEPHDELRLLLTGTEGLTVQLTLSLSAQPKAFCLTARGTRATLSIDLRNMLFRLISLRGRHRAIATAMELTGSAVGVIAQTAVNAIGILAGTPERHGSSYHLFRHHYAAFEAGGEKLFPGPPLAGLRHFQTLIAADDRLYVGADGRLYAFGLP